MTVFNWLYKAVTSLHPPESEGDHHGWRTSVFFWVLVLLIIVFGGLALNLGAFSKWGFTGVAWAADVDKKVTAAVSTLESRIDETDKKVDKAVETSKAVLRALYLPQIRAKVRQRCDTNDRREREVINTELTRIRAEYKTLAGEDFGLNPTCEEV